MEPDNTSSNLTLARLLTHREYHGYKWYLMAWLAFTLLVFCSLIAGLTLGVCGLDRRSLQMRSITGTPKQRKQARVVLQMKKQASWMLCSLIICSVAANEYLPFIIQDLCGSVEEWVPVLLSTLLIAVFAEIAPQWLIPRRAVSWGYYCWPLIWSCMWLTAIVSIPLAWLLDSLGSGRRAAGDFFTNEELRVIIKYHERSDGRPDGLSRDATRIILGALSSDGRNICGDISRIPEPSWEELEKDVENAELRISRSVIVKWSAVKTIDINEVVDNSFIEKVMSWSYSRIPVIGRPDAERKSNNAAAPSEWKGNQIYGFLHVKNLVSLGIGKRKTLVFVRDLPLYPLPLVSDDICVYELLSMFQLGMSRMAIIVPNASDTSKQESPLWTATERTAANIKYRTNETGKEARIWTTDYRAAPKIPTLKHSLKLGRTQGTRCLKPIGITTFEDIIDSLLQSKSRDEKDLFDTVPNFLQTKTDVSGKFQHKSCLPCVIENDTGLFSNRISQPGHYTVRNRKASKENGMPVVAAKLSNGQFAIGPSHTENSGSHVHGTSICSSMANRLDLPGQVVSHIPLTDSPGWPRRLLLGSATLPSRKANAIMFDQDTRQLATRQYFSATPRLIPLPMEPYFSQEQPSNLQSYGSDAFDGPDLYQSLIPTSGGECASENSTDTMNPSSCGAITLFECATQKAANDNVFDGMKQLDRNSSSGIFESATNFDERTAPMVEQATRPYDGFPPELLDLKKENQHPNYSSKTMPLKANFIRERSSSFTGSFREAPLLVKGPGNGRGILPSQRRSLSESLFDVGNRRSILRR